MDKVQDLLRRCNDVLSQGKDGGNDDDTQAILRESALLLKEVIGRVSTEQEDHERLDVQRAIARNIRKLTRLVELTDELLESAIKLEAMAKDKLNEGQDT